LARFKIEDSDNGGKYGKQHYDQTCIIIHRTARHYFDDSSHDDTACSGEEQILSAVKDNLLQDQERQVS
jgi:hypothetical protein